MALIRAQIDAAAAFEQVREAQEKAQAMGYVARKKNELVQEYLDKLCELEEK